MPIDPATDPTILSLLPVGLALALSITSRNVILGLFSGVFVGVLLVEGPSPIRHLLLVLPSDHSPTA